MIVVFVAGLWLLSFKKSSKVVVKPIDVGTVTVDSTVICQQLNGELREEGCFIGERLIMNEELAFFQERIASCQELDGLFLGGENMTCQIKEEIYSDFSWERIADMKAICVERNGEWLGGVDFKCEIDGEVYTGDWHTTLALRDSCLEISGQWLGNEELACRVDDQDYYNANWQRIEEMKTSCEKYDGQWQGGDNFACLLNGKVYEDKLWERAAVGPRFGERCEASGGTWLPQYQECEGLAIDWCVEAEGAFEEIRGLRFDQCLSACRHDANAEMCTEACVPVCSLNMF